MTDPIQQQLATARKNQILEAAAIVFAEKGFHSTTIRDIAKKAGIADGTIYNYFANKHTLLLGIFDQMRESVIQENLPPDPGQMDFRTFIRTFLAQPLMALKSNNFALFRIVISEMMVNEELRTLYYQQILQPTLMMAELYLQQQAGKPGYKLENPRLIVRAISGMVLGLTLEHIMGDPTLTEHWDQLPDVLTDLILNGLEVEEHST